MRGGMFMRELIREDIQRNHVSNLKQYYVLDYLKKNLNINEFKLYIEKDNNIKVIDKNNEVLYFSYDDTKKEVIYADKLISSKDDI